MKTRVHIIIIIKYLSLHSVFRAVRCDRQRIREIMATFHLTGARVVAIAAADASDRNRHVGVRQTTNVSGRGDLDNARVLLQCGREKNGAIICATREKNS